MRRPASRRARLTSRSSRANDDRPHVVALGRAHTRGAMPDRSRDRCCRRRQATTAAVSDACSAERVRASPVELDDTLNKVAREVSYDTPLDDAMQRVGYLAEKSTSLYFKVLADDAAIKEIIADRYCVGVRDEGFTEIGVYHFHLETWIVLARPIAKPAIGDTAIIEARVLELVNAARAQSRRCGDRELVAAPPLTLASELTVAAARHAGDMALNGTFRHQGSDGSESRNEWPRPAIGGARPARTSQPANAQRQRSWPHGSRAPSTVRISWTARSTKWASRSRWRRRGAPISTGRKSSARGYSDR